MKLAEINPFIRFAAKLEYSLKDNCVSVRDCRIIYVSYGSGTLEIGSESYNISSNTVFYCRSGESYNIKANKKLSLIPINFDLTQMYSNIKNTMLPVSKNKFLQDTVLKSPYIDDSSFLNGYTLLNNTSNFEPIFEKIVSEFSSPKIFNREYSGALLKQLIIDIHRNNIFKTQTSANATELVIEYIKTNYYKQITNGELARLTGYHEYHLNRLFLKYTGISLHKYMLSVRLGEAKRLLINTDMPVLLIAERVGFNNKTYFSEYFKRECKLTPTMYRQKYKDRI